MRAEVRDRIERSIDVVHADSVMPDWHELVRAGRDFIDRGNNVLAALGQPGPLLVVTHLEHPHLSLEGRDRVGQVVGLQSVFEHHRFPGRLG